MKWLHRPLKCIIRTLTQEGHEVILCAAACWSRQSKCGDLKVVLWSQCRSLGGVRMRSPLWVSEQHTEKPGFREAARNSASEVRLHSSNRLSTFQLHVPFMISHFPQRVLPLPWCSGLNIAGLAEGTQGLSPYLLRQPQEGVLLAMKRRMGGHWETPLL